MERQHQPHVAGEFDDDEQQQKVVSVDDDGQSIPPDEGTRQQHASSSIQHISRQGVADDDDVTRPKSACMNAASAGRADHEIGPDGFRGVRIGMLYLYSLDSMCYIADFHEISWD